MSGYLGARAGATYLSTDKDGKPVTVAAASGGFPSLEMQQYMAKQRVTAAMQNTLKAAEIADSMTRTGTYFAETSPRSLIIRLLENEALLSSTSWYKGVLAQAREAYKYSRPFNDLDVRIITAYLRGYAIPTK